MNAVEIEEAVEELVAQPFDRGEFPFQFLAAFGNKDTTVRRLRSGSSNNSDVAGGVLQRSNIHIATCAAGAVETTLAALRSSPRTEAQKAKFILATDGDVVHAEDLTSNEPLACDFRMLHEHFGFFLPLAGISTVSEIKNNPIDIKATGRLNKLYVELLKDNPEWGTPQKRPALNQFMARLIFCFFAEDTGIFREGLFSATIAQMSHAGHGSGDERWGNTHEVLAELFRAMDTDTRHEGRLDGRHRKEAGIKSWADVFPFVNGGLFTGNIECPKLSRIARSYLLRAGELNWQEINPDIFGSMIQAVADDDERGELGMHYTSVPNILKVLNPLFLDDLRDQFEAAGDNPRKLRNLRKRIASIRVFDPACGSGNFLVIAYLRMREIENELIQLTGDEPRSAIRLSNFYGIEIKSFAVEIARLSLLIAEFQADCRFINQHEARAMVLPLHRTGQIRVGNALREDWREVCPPARMNPTTEHDLAGPTGQLALEENSIAHALGGETYICGNPPYLGRKYQSADHKAELKRIFSSRSKDTLSLDYVTGWLMKAADYITDSTVQAAFVVTNSVCQGIQVSSLWPAIFSTGAAISFAYSPFKWSNLASRNAGVTVSILGIGKRGAALPRAFISQPDGTVTVRQTHNINAYLVPGDDVIVAPTNRLSDDRKPMQFGNHPYYANALMLTAQEARDLVRGAPEASKYLRPLYGSQEFIDGVARQCLWITQDTLSDAETVTAIADRISAVRQAREEKTADAQAIKLAKTPYRFRDQHIARSCLLVIPIVSSENREYLPVGLLGSQNIVHNRAFASYDAPLWNLALIASRLHWMWIGTVCGRLEMRFVYSNTIGWNTFPVPKLTEQNKADLSRSAGDILMARECHFPATVADLYEEMPEDLRRAHEANDDILERIYIGRRFRNDSERLEKLFELYSRAEANKFLKN